MRNEQRSGCPINLSLEVFGDRWSLIVIRDLMFGNRGSRVLTRPEEKNDGLRYGGPPLFAKLLRS